MHRINAGSGTLVSGVGIAFLQDVQGERQTYVHRIYKGGSAEQDGKVQVGDVLEKVEHLPVHGKPLSEIKHIMLGEVGTYVNLLFRRTNPDGSIVQYDVSLMRGQTESFLLKEKQRLQSLLDSDRKQMQHAEIEIEALRGALYRADMHKNQDFDEKQHLTMAIKEKSLKIEELQALIISIQQEIDNMSKDLVDSSDIKEEMQNLTKMLADAESHIIAAKESLEKDQLLTQELQDKWKNEKLARTNCETRIAKLQMEFPAREEQERSYRMHQEQLKAKLEQSRSKAMEEMNDALRRKEEELRKLREAEKAEAESEEQFAQVSANNQEIQGRVRETEKSLRAAENARLDAVNRNEVLMAELSRIRNQLQMREQVINDLQAKIEEDFDKWQISLTSAKHGRKQVYI
uniref:PDZ domain-containing protein n=1 Tax=Guillardia theta TaxID=55529 RepID=A0A6U6BJF7_GUITH|mmetsp:Transcript_38636/g.121765  ORF Transcript_38636/g.121765 Transcript_38636/m.121765 type:complete len:403 (+) Transcript_38636:62-1270(+)